MKRDLGLEALARIQALDAREPAERFRRAWLRSALLPGRDAAAAWIRDRLGASPEAATFSLFFNDPYTVSREQWRKARYTWESVNADGESLAHHETREDCPMRALGLLVCRLAEAFGREWAEQGHLFVLTAEIPTLRPVVFVGVRDTTGSLRRVCGLLSEEIALFVRPQATTADVTTAYQLAQQRLYEVLSLAPRERIKPMTSERMRDLAVFGARIMFEEFPTWQDARARYEEEYPTDTTYRHSGGQGTFRRDVRAAYKRVTGMDLDFMPKRKGAIPTATIRLGEHEVTIQAKPPERYETRRQV